MIHHRPNIIHPLLERRHVQHLVRKTGPAPVNKKHPRKTAQPLQEIGRLRKVPGLFDVGGPARDEHQVRGATPELLVGNVEFA